MDKEAGNHDGDSEDAHAARQHQDGAFPLLLEFLAHAARQHPPHDGKTQQACHHDIKQHENTDSEDDGPAPLRLLLQGAVLVVHVLLGQRIVHLEPLEGLEIVVAAVHEDALLDFLVPRHRVVVKLLHPFDDESIMFLIFGNFLQHLDVGVADGDGIVEARLAVGHPLFVQQEKRQFGGVQHPLGHHRLDGVGQLCNLPVGKQSRRQVLQCFDQLIVPVNLRLKALLYFREWKIAGTKFPVLFRGGLAGVGHVEREVRLLRVEHQCNLVAALHHLDQIGMLFLVSSFKPFVPESGLVVGLLQFTAQHTQRLGQVLFFQHRVRLKHRESAHKHKNNQFFH